jgi:DNA-binding response OmpR family regulator
VTDKKALIVEDTYDVARIMELTLNHLGIGTFRAIDGPAALSFLENHTDELPDLILLDIGLPGMSGWEVLEVIKNTYPESAFRVIVMTAFNDPANRLVGKLQSRVARYMTKPFEVSELTAAVRETLNLEG